MSRRTRLTEDDSVVTVADHAQTDESGHLAVLGHTLLGSVSVVVGALRTLEAAGGSLSDDARNALEATIERNLAHVEAVARSLIHGDQRT